MLPIDKLCEIGIRINEGWDGLPTVAKPIVSGGLIIIGLLTYKVVVAVGIIAVCGARVLYHTGTMKEASVVNNDVKKDETSSDTPK